MLLIIRKKATAEEIAKMAQDFDGYIKLVVDVRSEILAGGGERPQQNNPSRDILSSSIRKKFNIVVKKLLL